MRDTKKSLQWITDLLNKLNIPFQIAGGLAAHIYGATREINDIDIDIPEESFESVLPHIKKYITYGPAFHEDEHWKLWLITLNHEGQFIDLGGAYKTVMFNHHTQSWQKLQADLSLAIFQNLWGITVPVISQEDLIAYKKILSREVDLQDIDEMRQRKI